MKKYRFISVFLVFALLLSLCTGCGANNDEKTAVQQSVAYDSLAAVTHLTPLDKSMRPESPKKYTLMVYFIGADLESDSGCASMDIDELMNSSVNTKDVNVVIYTGGCEQWHNGVPADRNMMYCLQSKGSFESVAATNSVYSMGNAATIKDMLDFTAYYYPAEKYGLVCWDHGGGSVLGYGSDQIYSGDGLTLQELQDGLGQSVFGSVLHLDLIGFDACLMGTLEMANAVAPYADYMIASEESEPGMGWDYTALRGFSGREDTSVLAKKIIDAYEKSADLYGFKKPDMTLSCLDLKKLHTVNDTMAALFGAMGDSNDFDHYVQYAQMRAATKEFAAGNGFDQIDAMHYAELVSKNFPNESEQFIKALQDMVVCCTMGVDNANGVSMYFPFNGGGLYFDYGGEKLLPTFYSSPEYSDFISKLLTTLSEGEVPKSIDAVKTTEKDITLQLTKEEVGSLAQASYSIFECRPNGCYAPVVLNAFIEPDETGLLRVDCNQDAIYVISDTGELLCPSRMVESGEKRDVYEPLDIRVSTEASFAPYFELQNCDARFYFENGSDNGILMSLTADADTLKQTKNDIRLDRWDCIACGYQEFKPTYDNKGNAEAFSKWDEGDYRGFTYTDVDEEFHFERHSLTESAGKYVLQFCIKDVHGNEYASDIFDLVPEKNWKEVTQQVDNGSMRFAVYEDHAEFIDFTGECAELAIPSQISGKPVTVIGGAYADQSWNTTLKKVTLPDTAKELSEGAFNNFQALEQINFPDGLEKIGARAFQGCTCLQNVTFPDTLQSIGKFAFSISGGGHWGDADSARLTEVTLPANITEIGNGAFSGCTSLKNITIKGKSNYKTVDGVLYTADDKQLLCYPAGKEETAFVIPNKVQTIGTGAFYGAKALEKVEFPNNLIHISDYAFYECDMLNTMELPDSLEWIGAYAFMTSFNKQTLQSVHIGPNLAYIGESAWGEDTILSFDVSEANEHFKSDGAMLLDKSGTVLLRLGFAEDGKALVIPEGIATVVFGALNNNCNYTELILPDSLISLNYQHYPDSLTKIKVGAHLIRMDTVGIKDSVQIDISPENHVLSLER